MSTGSRDSGFDRRGAPREAVGEPVRHAVFELLRWIGRHVRGFHTAVGLFLTIGFLFALAAVGAFAALAESVSEGDTRGVDVTIMRWVHGYQSAQLDVAALEITSLGSGTVVWIMILLASAFLWVSRHHYSVYLLWIAVLGGSLLNLLLKSAFDRPRPSVFEWVTPYAGHSSFPSGHAMGAVVMYWTLAYLIARLEPTRLLRYLTWLVAIVLIVLIGLSRVYLGVHYPTDVLAGFVIGFAWATFCALGIEAIRYFRHRKPGLEREEQDLEKGALEQPAR